MKRRIVNMEIGRQPSTPGHLMYRYIFAVSAWCLLTTVASAQIMIINNHVIDFTLPEQAAKLSAWSAPENLGCTKDGFGWNGYQFTSCDGWIETKPLAIGTSWRPTHGAGIRIKIETNYPAIASTDPHVKDALHPSVFVRYSADRVHWSDWQLTERNEDPPEPGTVLYTTRVRVPRRASQAYHAKLQQWSQRDDIAWASDEDEFCRWLVKQEPDFFVKERPFVGYVQFLLEASFEGSQRLTRFEANVAWAVSGIHQPRPKVPVAKKRQRSQSGQRGWNFKGVEAAPRQ